MTAPSVALPELRLRLPGAWWQIPLQDRDEAREALRGLMLRQFPGDARVGTRIALERRFLDDLERAIGSDALALHIALNVVPGAAVPLSAFVVQPTRRLTPALGSSPAATMEVLAEALRQSDDRPVHRFRAAGTEVARRIRHDVVHPPAGSSAEPIRALSVEYYLTIPETKNFLLVVFTAPLDGLQDVLVGFFDSLIRVAYWQDAPPPEAPVGRATGPATAVEGDRGAPPRESE